MAISLTTERKQALLDAIITGSSEEAEQARMVYADCLEELGDPASLARAQFIRAQCDAARYPRWDRRAVEARRIAIALEREHGETWKQELPALPGVAWERFERGFIASVTIDTVDVLRVHATAIRAAAPVTRVVLAQPIENKRTPPPSRWPWLRTLCVAGEAKKKFHAVRSIVDLVPELEIDASDAYDTHEWLAARKHIVPLRRFVATGAHPSGNALVQRLTADDTFAAQLEELKLGTRFVDFDTGYFDDPTMRAPGAAALAAKRFANVCVLDINLQRVTDAGLRAILASMPKLRELSARRCELAKLDYLAQSEGAPIEFLDLGANMLTSAGAIEVAQAPRLSQLAVLRLDGCEVGAHGVEAIVHGTAWRTLRVLELSRNPLALAGVIALSAAPRPAQLHTLKLANCDLTAEATRLLGGMPWLDELFELDLANNELAPELLAAISRVRVVGLASCAIGPAAAPALGAVWQHAHALELGGNPLGSAGVAALITKRRSPIVSLSLAGCDLDDAALAALGGARCERLQVLSLARNPSITAAGLAAMFESKALPALRSIDLSGCQLADDVIPVLVRHCKDFAHLDVRENMWTGAGLLKMAAAMDDLHIRSFKTTSDTWEFSRKQRAYLRAKLPSLWWYEDHGSVYGANSERHAAYDEDDHAF